jgi:hypothetical protein
MKRTNRNRIRNSVYGSKEPDPSNVQINNSNSNKIKFKKKLNATYPDNIKKITSVNSLFPIPQKFVFPRATREKSISGSLGADVKVPHGT